VKEKNYIIPKRIEPDDSDYPASKLGRLPAAASRELYAMGDSGILHNSLIGLLCSIQCPGSIVIKTFDVIRKLRDHKVAMIGGFHSPMERECLDLLLRGAQPVILCPARSLRNLRMGKEARNAVSEGRLLVLSCFGDGVRRTTASQSILKIFDMPPANQTVEFEGYFAKGVLGIFKIIRGFADLRDMAAISVPYELSDGVENGY
jgi:hypothetical protein